MAPRDSVERCSSVILVDVDGVLNVGIRDDPQSKKCDRSLGAFLLTESSRHFALRHEGKAGDDHVVKEQVEKLLSVTGRCAPSEEATYSDFVVDKGSLISPLLAERLAEIVHAAGDDSKVVLSSTWRHAEHQGRVTKLEREVSKHMIGGFRFKARTRAGEEHCAADRLRFLGDYLESLCASSSRQGQKEELRVLVLEDFFITPFDGWYCGWRKMGSVEDAEEYLRSRTRRASGVKVKIVHTYEEWRTESGLRVQIGAGLGAGFCNEAVAFLSGEDAEEDKPTNGARARARTEDSYLRELSSWLVCGVDAGPARKGTM